MKKRVDLESSNLNLEELKATFTLEVIQKFKRSNDVPTSIEVLIDETEIGKLTEYCKEKNISIIVN